LEQVFDFPTKHNIVAGLFPEELFARLHAKALGCAAQLSRSLWPIGIHLEKPRIALLMPLRVNFIGAMT
jgi:hypothetical protein